MECEARLTSLQFRAGRVGKAKTGKQTRPFARKLGDETVNVTSQANDSKHVWQRQQPPRACMKTRHMWLQHSSHPVPDMNGNVKIRGKRAARTRAARCTRLQADTALSARGARPTAARSYNNSGDRINLYHRLTTIGNRDTPPACVGTPKASLATHCRAHC